MLLYLELGPALSSVSAVAELETPKEDALRPPNDRRVVLWVRLGVSVVIGVGVGVSTGVGGGARSPIWSCAVSVGEGEAAWTTPSPVSKACSASASCYFTQARIRVQ